ncbi:general substrate transporter, partial [Naematelia encephala]
MSKLSDPITEIEYAQAGATPFEEKTIDHQPTALGNDVETIDIEQIGNASDLYEAVRLATEREHALTLRQAFKLYPASFWWAIAISFTIVMEGYDTYLLGNFLAYPTFAKKYGTYQPASKTWLIEPNWQVALNDVGTVGNVVGLLMMGVLTDRFGHRKVIMGGLIVITALIFMTFFAPNIQVLAASLALSGVPFGMFGIMGSAYASEICPLALRGFLTSFVNICWVIGQLIASGTLVGLVNNNTEWSFKIPFAIQWVWPIPLFLIAYFAPNSPWWLVKKGRLTDAKKSLTRLSSGSSEAEIRRTLAMMVHTDRLENEMKTKTSILDCFKGTNLRRTEIACMVLASQSLSGETFAYGSTYFFTQAGFSSSNAYKLNFGASAVAFVGTCLSWLLMIWFGRRTLILWGFSAMALDLFLVGCLTYASSQAAIWTQAALIIIWLGIYSTTLGPQSFGLAAEVSATRLRSQTIALARLTYQLAALVTNT